MTFYEVCSVVFAVVPYTDQGELHLALGSFEQYLLTTYYVSGTV